MACYRREGGCGPYENLSCRLCPASKPEYTKRYEPVVHARWIYFRNNAGIKQCKCSNCITSYGCLDTPYCPQCGATMDLESEGKDDVE